MGGTMKMPQGNGEGMGVEVVAEGRRAKEAGEAGAETVGGEDVAKKVGGG